jgi:hypothetical protein
MKMFYRAGRVAAMLVMGMSLVLVTTAPASASPTPAADDKSTHSAGAPRENARAAACPVSGQRVKISSSDRVYVVDPQGYLTWLPLESYNGLWDNFNNIDTYNNLFTECYSGWSTMFNARLVKLPSFAQVYIWDTRIEDGRFRWINSPAIFNKYRFSSSKIVVQNPVGPIAAQLPWNN